MRRILVFLLLALSAYGAIPSQALATQHNPPWAHAISFNDPAYGNSTQLRWGSGWLELSGYGVYDPINLSAGTTYNYWLNDDAVLIFSGHGAPGRIAFLSGGILAEDKFYPQILNSDPYYFVKNASYSQLGDNLLAMFIGCSTGLTDPRYGSLLDMSRAKGTDCAIGWNQTIYGDSNPIFGMGFERGVYYMNYKIDDPVGYHTGDADLMNYAYIYMMAQSYYKDSGMRNWTTKGQYGQRLIPARYGSW